MQYSIINLQHQLNILRHMAESHRHIGRCRRARVFHSVLHIIDYQYGYVGYINPISESMCLDCVHHVDYSRHKVVLFQREILTGNLMEYYTYGIPYDCGYSFNVMARIHRFVVRHHKCPFTWLVMDSKSNDDFYGNVVEKSIHVATVRELIIFVKNLICNFGNAS